MKCKLCAATLATAEDEETHHDWHEHLRAALIKAAPLMPGLAQADVRGL